MTDSPLSDRDLAVVMERMSRADWRLKWEILPGVMTPGVSFMDPVDICNDFGLPKDLTGLKAIDVGAWDGALSFELERRGAEVLAADIQDPDATAFNTAKGILGSQVRYIQASVYDLPQVLAGQHFDVVMFRAVYYHLKNPIGAFEALSAIAEKGATLCVEGECLRYYAENLDGKPLRDALSMIVDSDIPITLCYPGTYKRGENWFVPNIACFKGWMTATGFELRRHRIWEDRSLDGQRLIAAAVRTGAHPLVEHTILPSGWRADFDSGTEIIKGQVVKHRGSE